MSFFNFGKSKEKPKEFKDSLNTAVFTTKFVIHQNHDITYVTHEEEDGAWQFFSDDKFDDFESVSMVVGLGQMIKRDETLLELADLPVGYFASRGKKGNKWTVTKQ